MGEDKSKDRNDVVNELLKILEEHKKLPNTPQAVVEEIYLLKPMGYLIDLEYWRKNTVYAEARFEDRVKMWTQDSGTIKVKYKVFKAVSRDGLVLKLDFNMETRLPYISIESLHKSECECNCSEG